MKVEEISWHDSEIKKIQIEYGKLQLEVFNDALQKTIIIQCCGFVGLTDLWFIEEDTEIYDLIINKSQIANKDFLDLNIITNDRVCHIYCKDINILKN